MKLYFVLNFSPVRLLADSFLSRKKIKEESENFRNLGVKIQKCPKAKTLNISLPHQKPLHQT
jgi:hypothetical protein